MSRSRKKAIIKEKSFLKKLYWRTARAAANTAIRSCKDLEILEIPNPKTIINDYTYCDFIIDYEYCNLRSNWWTRHTELAKEIVNKCRRK
jgi:hypothetical protein